MSRQQPKWYEYPRITRETRLVKLRLAVVRAMIDLLWTVATNPNLGRHRVKNTIELLIAIRRDIRQIATPEQYDERVSQLEAELDALREDAKVER